MMEASGAGGTAVAIVVGIFEPGDVVELYHVDSENVLRAEGGERVGRRIVNDEGIVGFDGLIDGDHYFATGYAGGRYEERRLVAHQPDEAADQIQPAPQSAPITLGVDQTPLEDVPSVEVATTEPPAPAEGEQPLPEGLPEGVTNPVLEPPAPDTADSSRPEAAGPAQPTEDVNPPAPDAGAPNASDSSGTGQANGGAVEEAKVADVTVETTGTASPTETAQASTDATPTAGGTDAAARTDAQGQPVQPAAIDQSGAVAPEDAAAGAQAAGNTEAVGTPPTPAADAAPAPDGAPAGSPQDQLVKQAEGLGVANTENLSEDELRSAITAAGATPVA